jgi:hypothetical protein
MSVTKAEADLLMARVRAQVKKHGGMSDVLKPLRSAYAFWHPHPGDPGAFALLVEQVEKLEAAP